MKNAQMKNKYLQLVEAQSPEPQELPEMTTQVVDEREVSAKDSANTLPQHQYQHHRHQDASSSSEEPISSDSSSDEPQPVNPEPPRRASCDSQMSTSFVSTPSCRVSVPSVNGSQNTTQLGPSETRLDRSISRSMLELDADLEQRDFLVTWSNLTYSYKPSLLSSLTKKPNLVLRNLSGHIKSNQLVAVIGPSGCGKTTLLQFLAGNIPEHQDKLRIYGLNAPKVALIGQHDCLLPGLTARETLIYASKLQNCNSNRVNHEEHVNVILDQLGLSECADRSVSKLSGGQLKRVTIGQELLYPTNLLILDEVTSGLDASTSYSIIRLLKKLVSDHSYPMSIILSIHQPSAKLFSVFDKVYVMGSGQCVYEGGCQFEAINIHLSRFGLECPKYHNIADYLIEIVCSDSEVDCSTRDQMISFQQKHSNELISIAFDRGTNFYLAVDQKQFKPLSPADADVESQNTLMLETNGSSLYKAVELARRQKERPFVDHLVIHFHRSLLRISRSSILTYLQLVTYILLALQLSTFYGKDLGSKNGCPKLPMSFLSLTLSKDTESDLANEMRRLQENMNFLLVAIMSSTFAALEITVITFPLEAKTVKREWLNGWYKVPSYFIGRTLADLPFQLCFVLVFATIIYTLTDQIGFLTWRFATFSAILVMAAMIAQAVGFMFGAIFMNNLPAAVFTAPLFIFPSLLFSGFFSRVSQVPSFYKPMTYLSHFRYAFDALLVTLYGYDRCYCDQESLTNYHNGLENQTGTVRDMFRSVFGGNCMSSGLNENSIEDDVTNDPLFNLTSTTTPQPAHLKSLEDALVDSVFQHMNSTTSAVNETESHSGGAMDMLVDEFSTRITSMLNKQSNFGHDVPKTCQDFTSYLMAEFSLHDYDLMFSLWMLLIFVVVLRLISLAIISITISTKNR